MDVWEHFEGTLNGIRRGEKGESQGIFQKPRLSLIWSSLTPPKPPSPVSKPVLPEHLLPGPLWGSLPLSLDLHSVIPSQLFQPTSPLTRLTCGTLLNDLSTPGWIPAQPLPNCHGDELAKTLTELC